MRRRISRSELSLKLLKLQPHKDTGAEPGLLLIQVDGLSRRQMERAMVKGRLPFLHRLMKREKYGLHTHYSGLPSSTPGVQGELYYGVKAAVPAFSYYDRERREVVRMFIQQAGIRVEEELRAQGEPLLAGGSSYSNIYTGGAAESHFCCPDLGWGRSKAAPSRWRAIIVLALNAFSFFRMLGLLVVEFFLAVVDFFRGVAQGQSLIKELKFVPTRVGIAIMLREWIVAGASIDLARGLPIVHVNFLGYDEQAHRRGPSSAFAHWTLLGIDGAIRRLYSAALRSHTRDYAVWVFSDHGQEETIGFERETGRSLQKVMEEVFEQPEPRVWSRQAEERGIQEERAHWAGFQKLPRRRITETTLPSVPPEERIIITSMGPVGHVYDLAETSVAERGRLAEAMVARGVPLVLFQNAEGVVEAISADGHFQLPRDGEAMFGRDHPVLEEVIRDLVRIVHHPQAGEFVISGWRRSRRMLSFPDENGAHAGPGRDEVTGFLLLPPGTPIKSDNPHWFRPVNLRQAVLHHLKGRPFPKEARARGIVGASSALRVMTYNIHGCVGVDSKLSPARIARVIARHKPDVVALQEVDVGRTRSGWVDQARVVADLLLMKFHFFPAFEIEDEKYGLAVLSHFPMRLVKSGALPGLATRPDLEPRGAQWVAVQCDNTEIHIVNTHLGLRGEERRQQVGAILGEEWLGQLGEDEPLVVCGDMNAMPASFVHREISTRFYDVQTIVAEHRPLRTLYGRMPLGRIDHIFVSSHFEAQRVEVPRNALTCVASDHLPVFVELKLRRG